MRFATTLKTLIRSPLKSLLTLLLLTATTFAFVSRGVEYVATVQQIRAAEATYFATGTVEMTLSAYEDAMYERLGEEAYTLESGNYLGRTDRAILPLDSRVADVILSSKHLEKAETRLVSGGTHPEYLSVLEQPLSDLEQYDPNDKYVSSGTFAMTDVVFLGLSHTNDSNSRMLVWSREALSMYPDTFYISKTQTGNYMTESRTGIWDDSYYWTRNNTKPELDEYYDKLYEHWQENDMFLFTLSGGKDNDRAMLPCIDYPLINLSRIEREYGETDLMTILKDPAAYGCPRYTIPDWDDLVNTYYDKHLSLLYPTPHSDEEMVSIFDYFEVVERNRHTSEVVYTSDMDLIHKFKSGDMFIADGRALAEDETAEVCVIGADFADRQAVQLGDSRVEVKVKRHLTVLDGSLPYSHFRADVCHIGCDF